MEELEKQKVQIHDAKEELLHPSMNDAIDIMEAEGVCIEELEKQKAQIHDAKEELLHPSMDDAI